MAGKITTEFARVTSNDLFERMYRARLKANPAIEPIMRSHAILAIDPGETTGIAIYCPWQHLNIPPPITIQLAQLETKDVVQGYEAIRAIVPPAGVSLLQIVCEDYKVYGHKADSHKWAGLHTPQLIGAIKVLAHQELAQIHFQMASDAKVFVTDELLHHWGVYEPGLRHARDALRHLLRFMFFGQLTPQP